MNDHARRRHGRPQEPLEQRVRRCLCELPRRRRVPARAPQRALTPVWTLGPEDALELEAARRRLWARVRAWLRRKGGA